MSSPVLAPLRAVWRIVTWPADALFDHLWPLDAPETRERLALESALIDSDDDLALLADAERALTQVEEDAWDAPRLVDTRKRITQHLDRRLATAIDSRFGL